MTIKEVTPQTITKREAADRQLDAAIRLFFEDRDLLPVQTLVAAAHEVLFVLSGKKPLGSFLKGTWFTKPEMQKEWRDRIHAIPNFLKHAAKDATKTETFYPDTVEIWIFDCILMRGSMGIKHTREMIVFLSWFTLEHSHVFKSEAFGPVVATLAKQPNAISKGAAHAVLIDPVAYPVPGSS